MFGVLCAFAATIIWSGNFIIARGVSGQIGPVTLAFFRWTVASLAVVPLAWSGVRRDWPVIRKNWKYLLVTAFLGVTVFNTLLYIGGRSTAALNLSLISTSFPVFIVLLSRIFLGEPISYRRLGGIALSIGGIALLLTKGELSRLAAMTFSEGDIWMLLASVIFAVYSLLVRRKPRELGDATFLAATFWPGLLMLVPWMLWERTVTPWPTFTPTIIACILYIGLLAALMAYFCWNNAVARIGPAKAGFIYYSLPVFSGLEAYLILGEPITLVHLISAVCIVGGIYISSKG